MWNPPHESQRNTWTGWMSPFLRFLRPTRLANTQARALVTYTRLPVSGQVSCSVM